MSPFAFTSKLFRSRRTSSRRQELRRAVRTLTQIETLEDRRLLAVGDLVQTLASTSGQAATWEGHSVAMSGGHLVTGKPNADLRGYVDSGAVEVYDRLTNTHLFTIANPSHASGDRFGLSIAISGTQLVVGAPFDDTQAENSGAVYVFDLSASTPGMPVYSIVNPFADAGDQFGKAVAIDGNRLVVGASFDDTGASNAGSVYLFDLASSHPELPTTSIVNPAPAQDDLFGSALAIDGNRIVVGASFDDSLGEANVGTVYVYDIASATPEVPGMLISNPLPGPHDAFGVSVALENNILVIGAEGNTLWNSLEEDTIPAAGSVYIFDLASTTPDVPTATIDNPLPSFNDRFGNSVAISGSNILVGSYLDIAGRGSAYLYSLSNASLSTPTATLQTPDAAGRFGIAVAISGDDLLVGASLSTPSGGAYRYKLSSPSPETRVATIHYATPNQGDRFGSKIATSGERLAVGVPLDDTLAADTGRVFIFDSLAPSSDNPIAILDSPSAASGNNFGAAVALENEILVVGATGDDSTANDAGIAYVYDLTSPSSTTPLITLANPSPTPNAFFGSSVSVSGNLVAVGSPYDDGEEIDAGVVYLYDLLSATPDVSAVVLPNPAPSLGDLFGASVAITNNYVIVGAFRDDTAGTNSGRVYVFDLNSPTPNLPVFTLDDPSAALSYNEFGYSIAASGNYVVIGSQGTSTGVHVYDLMSTTPSSPIHSFSGPVYLDGFGRSVEIAGSTVVVGASQDDSDGNNAGIAYVYDLDSADPTSTIALLRNPAPNPGDQFGIAVAVSEAGIFVGAEADDTQNLDHGAVYVFEADSTAPISPIDLNGEDQAGHDFATTFTEDGMPVLLQDVDLSLDGASSAAGPIGSEFQVNTYTNNRQELLGWAGGRTVATDANGNFVVVWSGRGPDGSEYGVLGQRYDASGATVGGEFLVNTYTNNDQNFPSVAVDDAGNFVVAWTSTSQDGSGYGIYAQRYDSSGNRLGGDFRVNTFTSSHQAYPSVAMTPSGEFLVTWSSQGQDGDGDGVYAQRYDASGVKLGGEFQVNSFTVGGQALPSVAMNATGEFIIAWESLDQDGSSYGIFAQRYDSTGTASGGEFQVNTFTGDRQQGASVAMDGNGNVLIAWTSLNQDGSGYGIYAQRFGPSGAAVGGELQVNTFANSHQIYPSVAMNANGDTVVTWGSVQDGSGYGVYAQEYNASGAAVGSEFQVNSFTTGSQDSPSVAMNGTGDYVVAWNSDGQDGSSLGVFAQRRQGGFQAAPNIDQASIAITNLLDGAHETLAANTVGTNITATYAAGVLSLSGSDTPFNYQQILRSVTYHNASQNPTTTPRIIEFTYTRSSVTSPISTTSLTIVSANDAPTVSATENSIVVDEGSIAVNSGVFDDVEGSPTISVDIGTVVDNGNGTWSWSFSALEGPGESQLVTVTATDDLGSAATASFGLTVNNVAPTFHTIVVAPQVNENEPVSLSFSTIAAGTLDTHSILIDWGDGSTSTFPFNTPGGFSFGTNHTYTDDNPTSSPADIYSIVVTVTDDDGGQASFSRDVIVNNVAPAFSTVSLTPTVDENGTVTITGAFSDPGTLDSHTFVVNWGDGNSEAVPFQNATTVLTPVSDTVGRDDNLDGEYELLEADHFEAHTFELMPDRERRFAMEFDLTAFSATDTLQSSILSLYSVGGTPPGLATIEVYGYSGDGTFGAADMQAGYKIAGPFTDSAADLASIDLTSFLQSRLGAGATHAGIVLRSVVVERQTQLASANSSDPALRPKLHVQFANRHTFTTAHPFLDDNAADSYDITVTVTDDDGGIAALTRQVVVSNVAPVLSALTITPEIDENGTVNVSFNGGDVGTIDTHTINIDWGDGSTNTFPFTTPGGFSFGTAHTYLDDNATDSYNVTLTLTDDDGGVAEETRLVTVNNLAPTIAADLSLVTISEGSTATNTGTFSDPGTNDTVLLSASEGQIVDNGNGTWGWSLLTTDGPSESRTITITATDDDRGTSSSTFDLLVNNVVPVATLAGPTTAIKNQQLAFVVSSSDASSHDQAQGVGYIVEFGDGFTIEVSRMLGNSSGFTVYHTYMTTGSFEIKATATDIDGGTSVHAAQTINVAAITSQDLQTSINQVIASGGSEPTIEVLAITETDLDSMINAIGNISLAADAPPVQLVLSLGNMQFSGKTISVPAGVTVTIANGSLTGASPALTVTSGIVVAANVTFNNSTPASTILVNGGNLILRGSTVNETDGGDFAAIEILGGSVDLGTAADAGGNTLHVHGAGQAIRNVTSQAISALGNTFQFDGELAASGYQIEDVVNHALDSTGTGLVTWETGQIYVTHDSGSV